MFFLKLLPEIYVRQEFTEYVNTINFANIYLYFSMRPYLAVEAVQANRRDRVGDRVDRGANRS